MRPLKIPLAPLPETGSSVVAVQGRAAERACSERSLELVTVNNPIFIRIELIKVILSGPMQCGYRGAPPSSGDIL